MSPLEFKVRIRELEDRVKKLEDRQKPETYVQVDLEKLKVVAEKQKNVKLCPHCGVEPAYFFHVRACENKKNKNDGKRTPGTT